MTDKQLRETVKKLRKNVALLTANGTSGWFRAETFGELLVQALTLARKEILSKEVSKAAAEIGFTLAAFDTGSATGSDADIRTLAKNAKAFSKALCEAAVNGTR